MNILTDRSFEQICWNAEADLLTYGEDVPVETWHAQDVRGKERLISRELSNVYFEYRIPQTVTDLAQQVKPNLPWAEEHFLERVSGRPLNPPPSHVRWPWASSNEKHMKSEQFSHTYPERYWPKLANGGLRDMHYPGLVLIRHGIRYDYGDLEDVVRMLVKTPLTRQAYLPVWFPEDTGAAHGERVPCTLGYHFTIREGKLDVVYFMRSCDLYRYFRDDVYLTCRLVQWLVDRIVTEYGGEQEAGDLVRPGRLHMWITSLHLFKGDLAKLEKEVTSRGQTSTR